MERSNRQEIYNVKTESGSHGMGWDDFLQGHGVQRDRMEYLPMGHRKHLRICIQ
jgi:hypothetical protein